jgi:hypothetical protein
MPNTRVLQRSFSGGELSPEMFGRIDDVKYQTGAATMRNIIATPQGPAENRPGFAFVKEVKDSTKQTRLIPFTYSTTQTMVIEVGAGYFRFHTQGATLQAGSPPAYKASTAVTLAISKTATVTMTIASPCVVTWTGHTLVNGDRVVFTTTGALPTGLTAGVTYYVINQATNTFQVSATLGGSAINTSGTQSGTHTATTPTTVTWTAHGFANNEQVAFTTTGALPTGMTANTSYFVRNFNANTFDLLTTSGGSQLVTSGTQSGTQTGHKVYLVGDLVSFSGNNFYCIQRSVGNSTSNTSFWYQLPTSNYEMPNPYAEADLFDIHYVQSADVLTLVHPNYEPRELRRVGATNWQLSTINFNSPIAAPTGVTATATGHTSAKYTYYYVVTSIDLDGITESAQSAQASASGNLLETGGIVTITWTAQSSASRYNVYKLQGGVYGYIGSSTSTSIIDDNIAPDMGTTPPIYNNDFIGTGNYPGAVSYFEQRKCFAGTTLDPQKIWMTKSGTESTMAYSLPTQDTDRIEFRVAAREANTIRHIVPLTQLILLTAAAEWRVTSVNSDALTPSSISVRPQSYIGASNVQPQIINNALVYCAARGGHVRELGYSWQSSAFITGDVSLRSAHLFDNYTISDMAYSKAPVPLLWFVSSSGRLLGLTYIPEQQIASWHWHDTDGVFESCTAVAEGNEDVLYVIVKRIINGVTKRYVERMQSRHFDRIQDCFFVDSGLTYNGANTGATTCTVSGGTTWGPSEQLTIQLSAPTFTFPGTANVGDAIVLTATDGTEYRITLTQILAVNEAYGRVDKVLPAGFRNTATTRWALAIKDIGGLSHLEGKTVSILADGAVQPRRVVTGGVVSVPRPATVIHIGLPYDSDLQTLPVAMQIDGFGQGRYKNVNKAWLRVYQSSGIFVGPDADNLVEAKQRTTEPYGTPPSLKTQEILVMTTPKWADSGQVYVRQSDPLPLTVVSLTLEIAVGG